MAINDQNQAPSSAATNDEKQAPKSYVVERVPSSFRIEKRILKVLKGLAEYHEISLGNLVEGIVLYAFEGKCALSPESRACIDDLKKIYSLDLDASAADHLIENEK